MWNLYQKATKYGKLPSEIFGEEDSLAAWMLDSAVTWFGITIENALAERDKVRVGSQIEYRPRYTLSLLLDPEFKLPKPVEFMEKKKSNPWAELMSWVGRSKAVRRWQYVPPLKDKPDE